MAIPGKVVDSVIKNLEITFGDQWREKKFAVRSSATGEDTAQMSAAGQMETFLGMKGKDQILDALRKCWASQFFIHPVQYKRRYGQLLNMPMAVVIQEMVPCDVAGVLFTCDPVNGSPEFLSISANYGLGESVVSASVEPDTVTIRKDINNRLTYHSEVVGQKKSKIVMESGTGTKQVDLDTSESKCCLGKDEALKLAGIAVQIEDEFGDPRDIEWGIANNKIFLFQSRPVTTVDVDTEFESKHFTDSHLRAEEEYMTKANVGEVCPGSMSPLSLDISQRISLTCGAREWGYGWDEGTGPDSPYIVKTIASAYGHYFILMIDGFLSFFDEKSGASKAMMISIFGRLIDERHKVTKMSIDRHRPKGQSFFQYFHKWCFSTLFMFFTSPWIKIVSKELKTLEIPSQTETSASRLFHTIGSVYGRFWKGFYAHILATTATSNWNLRLLSLLAEAKGEFDNEVYSDFAYLLSTCTQLESADIPSAIQNLGYSISKCIDPKTFKEMDVEEALKWLQTTKSEAGVKFHNFLKRHGHRCLKEFDIYTKPWGWEQRPLVAMLQTYMSGNVQAAEEKKEVSFSEIIEKLHVKLDFLSRLKLRFILPNSRRCVREREATKSLIVKITHLLREPLYKLAELMVQEGRLPQKDLLFFLYVEEIHQLLKTRSPRIVARAQKRFGYYPELDKLMFPEIICGVPRPVGDDDEDYGEAVEGTIMTGFPVSQGVVKAPARVVPTLADACNIKPGDILITYSTDIGWSPYFPLLSGVVTELGGLVSHGAVVAREYGLPCVVGLHGASKVFKSGDIVVLDGMKGTIRKVGTEQSS